MIVAKTGKFFFSGSLGSSISMVTNGIIAANESAEIIIKGNQPSIPVTQRTIGPNAKPITNTVLLTSSGNRFLDRSTSAHPAVQVGDPEVASFSPFTLNNPWDTNDSGSTYFDGTGDYLTVADSADFDLASAWTFETWVYPTNLGSGFNSFYQVGVDSSNGFVCA